jgi:hypothetical protein
MPVQGRWQVGGASNMRTSNQGPYQEIRCESCDARFSTTSAMRGHEVETHLQWRRDPPRRVDGAEGGPVDRLSQERVARPEP